MTVASDFEGWAWGVDVGLSRVTIGALSADDFAFASRRTDGLYTDLPRKLIELVSTAQEVAANFAEDHPPAAVAVEMPFGKFRPTEFGAAFGATVLGVERALRGSPHPAPLWTVTVSEWKAATVGRGNCGKPAVAEWVRQNITPEAPSQDVADALAIAAFNRSQLVGSQ